MRAICIPTASAYFAKIVDTTASAYWRKLVSFLFHSGREFLCYSRPTRTSVLAGLHRGLSASIRVSHCLVNQILRAGVFQIWGKKTTTDWDANGYSKSQAAQVFYPLLFTSVVVPCPQLEMHPKVDTGRNFPLRVLVPI
jgi:hypothetical protein